jgi:hypothetical protein
MDPATLAASAIAAAIAELGKAAAKSAAGAAGKSVWEWIKSKLTSGPGKSALDDLENEKTRGDTDNQTMAATALSKFLKTNPAALAELAQLLEKAGVASTVQTATVHGDHGIVAQNAGPGKIAISTGTARAGKPSKAR